MMDRQESANERRDAQLAPSPRPKLLWVHGWGMSSSVWSRLAKLLPEFEHRYVSYTGSSSISSLLDAVYRPLLEEPDGEWHAVGWSMGGMLLLEALAVWQAEADAGQERMRKEQGAGISRHIAADSCPPAVRSVILTGTTLRFIDDTGRAGWPDRVVRRMRRRLAQAAPADTLRAFAECIPSAAERASADSCRWLAQHTAAIGKDFTPAGLDAGLTYLQQADLERAWARLTDAPDGPRLLWLHGADDSVCPLAAQQRAQAASGSRNAARCVVLPLAGHAPFATQTAQWIQSVRTWCSAPSTDIPHYHHINGEGGQE
ncbi:alpha/beta fold hydrolase [Paenibacillus alvei]|uniref:alpha/beta fold hydrolase n=1 Tax=Paenibacillus alvei TaxID=44250 RepID=UPI002281EB32|nr:alpha/beta fold hydrolase [Paenibacillus alvei]MCY7485667.1 alpha/beta fold hydrolase [Paenibacillus alvei]